MRQKLHISSHAKERLKLRGIHIPELAPKNREKLSEWYNRIAQEAFSLCQDFGTGDYKNYHHKRVLYGGLTFVFDTKIPALITVLITASKRKVK